MNNIANCDGLHPTTLVQEEVTDFADGVIGCVIHILLVVIVHTDCIALRAKEVVGEALSNAGHLLQCLIEWC